MSVFDRIVTYRGNFNDGHAEAYSRGDCTECGKSVQMGVVGFRHINGFNDVHEVEWMLCASCGRPYLRSGGKYWPPAPVLPTPGHLEGDVLAGWDEVASCLSVGAFAASQVMCRKILFHIAVAHGLEEENERGYSPNFTEVVNFLVDQGVVSKNMLPWVTMIREAGNAAAHKLATVARDSAVTLAEFTRQLLILEYEIPGNLKVFDPSEGDPESAGPASTMPI